MVFRSNFIKFDSYKVSKCMQLEYKNEAYKAKKFCKSTKFKPNTQSFSSKVFDLKIIIIQTLYLLIKFIIP
jgi:hypothetical protein